MKILEKIGKFVLKALLIIVVLSFIVFFVFFVPHQFLREGFYIPPNVLGPDLLGVYFTCWGCYVLFACVVGCLAEWYEEGFSPIRHFPVLRVIMIGLLMLIAGALFLILGEFNYNISLIDLPK